MTKILSHLKGNIVAYIALFVALGGTSYAAVRLPAGSVGNRQLKNHSITPIKFDRSPIAGYVRAWAQIGPQGQLLSSRPRARIAGWGGTSGLIQWSQPILPSCFALATTSPNDALASSASAQLASGGSKTNAQTYVLLSAPGRAVNLAIICPQP